MRGWLEAHATFVLLHVRENRFYKPDYFHLTQVQSTRIETRKKYTQRHFDAFNETDFFTQQHRMHSVARTMDAAEKVKLYKAEEIDFFGRGAFVRVK